MDPNDAMQGRYDAADDAMRAESDAAYKAGFDAGLERAAEISDTYDGPGMDSEGQYAQLGNAGLARAGITDAIRAEKSQ